MTKQYVAIVGSGMVTGVGLTAQSSCAAIRCGVTNFQESQFRDSAGDFIVASEVPMEQPWRGTEKLARMLAAVVTESFQAEGSLNPSEIPLIVCFAERERAGRLKLLEQRVVERAQALLEFKIHSSSITVSQGRVGGVVALREARRMLFEERHSAVVIVSVDSYLSCEALKHFEQERRLLTASNSNGFVPGEGAAAVIARKPISGDEPQLLVAGIGFGIEKATIESEEPLRADGLAQAIRQSMDDAGVDFGWLDFRIADVSGEQYGFKEATLALARILRSEKEQFDIWHAADCIGEVGSAAGPVAFNVAWHANEKKYSKGDNVLCHFSNDDGKRAAAILTYQSVSSRGQ